VQQFEGVGSVARCIKRANATHSATRWGRGAQRWLKPAIYPQKSTDQESVFVNFAVRQTEGTGTHDGQLIAVAPA